MSGALFITATTMVFIVVEIHTPSSTAAQAISTGIATATAVALIIGYVLAELVPAAGRSSQGILLLVMANTGILGTPSIIMPSVPHGCLPEILGFQEVRVGRHDVPTLK